MKLSTIFSTLALVAIPSIARALPKRHTTALFPRASTVTDIDILNFALTLEHIEVAFYTQGLANFTQQDFLNSGLPDWTRGRYEQIAEHEKTHVDFLTAAITAAGATAAQSCNYSYPVTDIKSFTQLSHIFETVGTFAYNGAAAFIQNKSYLTVAASILGIEARQASWIGSAVLKANPWNTAFETPLDLNQVFTLASPFIVSCPSSNPPISAKPFPALTTTAVPTTPNTTTSLGSSPSSQQVQLAFPAPTGLGSKQLFAAFITGTGTVFVPIDAKTNQVELPKTLVGFVIVVVTSDGGRVADETTVAGPGILQLPFDSRGTVGAAA